MHTRLFFVLFLLLATATPALGQTGASAVLPTVTVTAPVDLESRPTDAASEQRISG